MPGRLPEVAIPCVMPRSRSSCRISCAPGRQQVPDGVADHVAVLGLDAESLRALDEQVGLGLGARDVPALDDHHVGGDLEGVEAGVDPGAAAGGGDAVRDPALAQLDEDLLRARQRAPLVRGQQLAEQAVVDVLQLARLLVGEVVPDLAADRAREQAAAHPDLAVDAPAVDRQAVLMEGLLPGEDVGIDGVDEGSVEVEDQRRHQACHASG